MNAKKRILGAAEHIMAAKGMGARISEIAAEAGVKDSVIYHYFKNKEDLLFSIAEERYRDIREQIEEQLSGIDDPLSMLRKLIHFRLRYVEKNKNYGDLLLFECRSNMRFYSHPAFTETQRIMSLLGKILRSGMETGAFSAGLNVRVVRDAVFGLVDMANIRMFIYSDQEKPLEFDTVINLIRPMIMPKAKKQNDLKDIKDIKHIKDKRERILAAAENIFAEKGYENATIQDIASRAGVGDGTVYDYFKNKEDLLFNTLNEGFQPSGLKKGFQDHLEWMNSESAGNDPVMELERFIRKKLLLCLTQPSFTKVFILNGIFNKSYYSSEAYGQYRQYMSGLDRILADGQSKSLFRSDVSADSFRALVTGAFSHMMLRWLLSEKKTVIDKTGEINAMTGVLVRAVMHETVL